MTVYTQPERACEVRISKRIRSQVLQDPCGHCIHREPEKAFGRSVCSGTLGRTFWACVNDGRNPTFTLDEATIE